MPASEVAPGFAWFDSPAGRLLVAEPLRPYARHGFTTRRFGMRPSDGHQSLGALAAVLDLEPTAIVRGRQVHGRGVIEVRAGSEVNASEPADALVSSDPSRAIAVAIADCVPILIADRRRRAVAAIHAGWRGTASRIVVAAVETLARSGVPASDLVAAIGPSIGPCCYQVDAPVRNAMIAGSDNASEWLTPDGAEHWRLDLWRANRDQLREAGVAVHAIHVARYCTADHLDDCYSYRKEGTAAGRMFGAIRLLPEP